MAFSANFLSNHIPPPVTTWSQDTANDLNEHTFHFEFPPFTLQLCLSINHQHFLSSRVLDTHSAIPRRILDPLRQHVRSIFLALYNNNKEEENESCGVKEADLQVAILQALEHLSAHHEEASKSSNNKNTPNVKTTPSQNKGYSASEVSSWDDIVSNPIGLDVSTIRDTASFLLGMTPAQIAEQIPQTWRIIHMESIMREDLLKRFTRYREHLREFLQYQPDLRTKLPPLSALQKRYLSGIPMDDILDDMVKPRVTFHGTNLRAVRSIIRNGFLLPGQIVDGKRVESPRSGIAFNRGIYSSQSASYAMSYASGQRELTPLGVLPSMRLFVCATVMGRTYVDKPGSSSSSSKLGSVHGPLVSGYDSAFDGGYEFIVHEPRGMLPIYVIHLDLGSEMAQQSIRAMQLNPAAAFRAEAFARKQQAASRSSRLRQGSEDGDDDDDSPGGRKRRQLALKAAAMKWFPYGFGTATGTSFVIEEIGEVSDDSETYGDWQEDKHAYEAEDGESGSRGHMSSGLFLDQYQQDLETNGKRRNIQKTRRVDDE